MLPFHQHVANQQTSVASGVSAPQQAIGCTSNMLPNLMQIQSQMSYVNPQLSIPFDNNYPNFNAIMGYGNNPSAFSNIPNFNGMGNSILGSAQHIQSRSGLPSQNFGQNLNLLGFPVKGQLSNVGQANPAQLLRHNPLSSGQLGWQNHLPNVSQFGNMPLLDPCQVNALTQLLGCANQVAQAMIPQSTTFLGNSQLGFGQPNGGLQTCFNQQPNVSIPPSSDTASSHPHGQSSNLQGNHVQKLGMNTSNSSHHQNKSFMKNPKREVSNWRSKDHHMHNPKGKGIKDAGANNSSNKFKSGKQRSIAMLYTEKEIQQWREERKKNYPSLANVEKKQAQKLGKADYSDEDAKLRRDQLKDVLAKQVELGFEVPEIPSHYLLDSEHQAHERDKSGTPLNKGHFQKNGRLQYRFNRGGKFDRNDRVASKRGIEEDGSFRKHDRYTKRRRLNHDNSSKTFLSTKEPTLLQKLLSTDIKRDKSRLLQAVHFMVINSFFEDWPKKPLNFPKVIIKETGVQSDVIEGMCSSDNAKLDKNEDHDILNDTDVENDCQEEGEITD